MSRRLAVVAVVWAVGVALGASPASAGTKTPTTMSLDGPVCFCGVQAQPQTVTVTNTGDNPTGNLTVKIKGQGAANFKVSNNGCNSQSLAPLATCSFVVTWLIGPDSTPTLTVAGKNASVSVGIFGTEAP